MTRTTPELASSSPNFRVTPTGGRLVTAYDLACNGSHTRRIFSGIGFRTCDQEVETLPLGHRGLYKRRNVLPKRARLVTSFTKEGMPSLKEHGWSPY
ncbi:hypothetical protein AVEN_254234-1 [Araneus ventricosus]|uniref:Uncharacterized protein n=1 Tax=Araneus ventricosus TaxID=182803 RepID=A0A4Y2PCQ1_ARAVE|nr:hypothetical protein AVEN_254234-1 [Araneus ventricosus]